MYITNSVKHSQEALSNSSHDVTYCSSVGESSMVITKVTFKLRFLVIIIAIADLINERTTFTMSTSHAIMAPVAIFATFILIGTLVITRIFCKNTASMFFQCYSLLACSAVQTTLAITVFTDLKEGEFTKRQGSSILNGVLPMFILLVLLIDLVTLIFSSRQELPPPSVTTSSPVGSGIGL